MERQVAFLSATGVAVHINMNININMDWTGLMCVVYVGVGPRTGLEIESCLAEILWLWLNSVRNLLSE